MADGFGGCGGGCCGSLHVVGGCWSSRRCPWSVSQAGYRRSLLGQCLMYWYTGLTLAILVAVVVVCLDVYGVGDTAWQANTLFAEEYRQWWALYLWVFQVYAPPVPKLAGNQSTGGGGGQGSVRMAVHHRTRGRGIPPPPKAPPPPTKVTIVGKNEDSHRGNLVGPFVVHNFRIPDPLPPSKTLLETDKWDPDSPPPEPSNSPMGGRGGGSSLYNDTVGLKTASRHSGGTHFRKFVSLQSQSPDRDRGKYFPPRSMTHGDRPTRSLAVRRGGGAHGNAGRQVADDQDDTRRGGAMGPHAHGNAARPGVDDLDVEGCGQQKP